LKKLLTKYNKTQEISTESAVIQRTWQDVSDELLALATKVGRNY